MAPLAPLLALLTLSLASARVQEELGSIPQQALVTKAAPFTACIDDSDCRSEGANYACFQYICYPWAEDSSIPEKDRKATCKSNDDCKTASCFRHHDRRQIHKGLCMEEARDCSENGRDDCRGGGSDQECCNAQFCCEKEYFDQLKALPCVNHMGCKDLGYGNFCCPQDDVTVNNETVSQPPVCCNTDPNPTTTMKPTTLKPTPAAKTSSAASLTTHLSALLLAPLVLLRK